MKALFLSALVCAAISMSGFKNLNQHTHQVFQTPLTITAWPLQGTTSTTQGVLAYTITGNGQTPGFITFYNSANASVGSYPFLPTGATGGSVYLATGMKATLGISGVQLGIYTNQPGYTLDFFGQVD
jgi:hypothetical protein